MDSPPKQSHRASDKSKLKDPAYSNIAKLLQKKHQMEDTGGDYIDEEDAKLSPNSKVASPDVQPA